MTVGANDKKMLLIKAVPGVLHSLVERKKLNQLTENL